MAKKKPTELSFYDIITRSQSDIIAKALEARLKIDELLIEREEAYMKIASLENEIEDIVGHEGNFTFDAPPIPVAGLPGYKAPKKTAPKAIEPEEDTQERASEDTTQVQNSEKPSLPQGGIPEILESEIASQEEDKATSDTKDELSYIEETSLGSQNNPQEDFDEDND